MKKLLIILFCIVFFADCSKKKQCYEILDEQHFKSGNAQYAVYSPNTNWIEMENFAKSLLNNKEKHSAVIFFNSKSDEYKFKKNGSPTTKAFENYIGLYNLVGNTNYFKFFKSDNRLKIKLDIQPCP
jgi:hypothetical protein